MRAHNTKLGRTGASVLPLRAPRKSNTIPRCRLALISFTAIMILVGITGCTKTAKQHAVVKERTPEMQKDTAPPPELALYHAFSNWVDAFNSLDAKRMFHRCTRSSLARLRSRFNVRNLRSFDSLVATLRDSSVFPFGARITGVEILDLTIQSSSGNITASYRLVWKDLSHPETGIFSMKRENGNWNVTFFSSSSFFKGWWRRFGKNLELLDESDELVFNQPATPITFRYPREWIASYPVPVRDLQSGVEKPGILIDVPGTGDTPLYRLIISVIDSSSASADSMGFKRQGVTIFGPREVHLPGEHTGLQWFVKHMVSGKWIRVIAFSDSGMEDIQPHRRSIEKLLSTMNIITHRK